MTKTAMNGNARLAAMFLSLVLGGLAAVITGCGSVNINVDADSYARKYIAVADRATAIHIAKDRASKDGYRVDDYRASAQEDQGAYWVTFELIPTGESTGRPARFVVHVASDGSTEVYKHK
jgi:hypothetical protein